ADTCVNLPDSFPAGAFIPYLPGQTPLFLAPSYGQHSLLPALYLMSPPLKMPV